MGQSGTNSFTTYLQGMQRWEKEKQATQVAGTAFSILALLAANGGQTMPLRNLQAGSAMDFTRFADAIKRLQELRYITLSGGPTDESAQLTEFGSEVAALARTA